MIKSIRFENIKKLAMNASYNRKKVIGNAIELKNINVFCGVNGGGKSTVLDMVRGLIDYSVLKSLPRENMNQNSKSSLELMNIDDVTLKLEFSSVGVCKHKISISLSNGQELDKIKNSFLKGVDVKYISFSNNIYDESSFCNKLNDISETLVGSVNSCLPRNVFSYLDSELDKNIIKKTSKHEFIHYDDANKRYSIHTNDDRMYNHISESNLPSGWIAYGNLLVSLEKAENNSICLIEEPETHLHPHLQRLLIKKISKIQDDKKLQILIATHSPIFINPLAWGNRDDIGVFFADGYGIHSQFENAKLLAELGVQPADMFQSNGIIWVEGPSDRIYIEKWLDLYCKHHKKERFVENVHYSYIFYGGKLMKHYETDSKNNEKISLVDINRNFLFIYDKDFGDEKYKEHFRNDEEYEECIYELEQYTIECFLPENTFNKYFKYNKKGGVTKKSSKTKVDIAESITSKNSVFDEYENSYAKEEKYFIEFIEKVYNSINKWNKYLLD